MLVKYQLMGEEEVVNCMTAQQAQDLLHHCLEDGKVVPGRHFREELEKEGVSFEDAWWVLRSGQVYDPPEMDPKSREWKYRVEGNEPGGKWIVIVFCFKAIDTTFLITIFSVECRRRESPEK